MALIYMRTAASPRCSQSEPLFTRAFYIHKGWQPDSYCLLRTMRALAWLVTSNLACLQCTLLCRWQHHASEIQHLFATGSLSDVSWVKSVVWRSDAIPQVSLDDIKPTLSINKDTLHIIMSSYVYAFVEPKTQITQYQIHQNLTLKLYTFICIDTCTINFICMTLWTAIVGKLLSLTNTQLVGKGRKMSNLQLAKVGKHRETTESSKVSWIPTFSTVGKSRNFWHLCFILRPFTMW
jgi:hypothetical protein